MGCGLSDGGEYRGHGNVGFVEICIIFVMLDDFFHGGDTISHRIEGLACEYDILLAQCYADESVIIPNLQFDLYNKPCNCFLKNWPPSLILKSSFPLNVHRLPDTGD